jgi:hypothetical protein
LFIAQNATGLSESTVWSYALAPDEEPLPEDEPPEEVLLPDEEPLPEDVPPDVPPLDDPDVPLEDEAPLDEPLPVDDVLPEPLAPELPDPDDAPAPPPLEVPPLPELEPPGPVPGGAPSLPAQAHARAAAASAAMAGLPARTFERMMTPAFPTLSRSEQHATLSVSPYGAREHLQAHRLASPRSPR